MTRNSSEIERLIADVEAMTPSQRLLFVEVLLRSFKEHELNQFMHRFQNAAGSAHALKNLKLINHAAVPILEDSTPTPGPVQREETI